MLKSGEEVLPACPGKRLNVIEALVGGEAAWMDAGVWRCPECGQLSRVLSLPPCFPFGRCLFHPCLSLLGCQLSAGLPVLKILH